MATPRPDGPLGRAQPLVTSTDGPLGGRAAPSPTPRTAATRAPRSRSLTAGVGGEAEGASATCHPLPRCRPAAEGPKAADRRRLLRDVRAAGPHAHLDRAEPWMPCGRRAAPRPRRSPSCSRQLARLHRGLAAGRAPVRARIPGNRVLPPPCWSWRCDVDRAPCWGSLACGAGVRADRGPAGGDGRGGNTLFVWLYRSDVPPYMNALHLFFGVGAFSARSSSTASPSPPGTRRRPSGCSPPSCSRLPCG